MRSPVRWCALLALLISLSPPEARAQSPERPWSFRTRVVLSGMTDHSTPPGYTMYSGIALDAAVRRTIARRWAVELAVRTESREVDRETPAPRARLGALELLPISATVLYQQRAGRVRPYAGAGVAFVLAWEKSGVLDSLDVAPHAGPAIQLGADLVLGPSALLTLDLRWQTLTTTIDGPVGRFARLRVDPVALGLGVGFRF